LYRDGLLRRIHCLEKQKLIARERKRHGWVVRVTESGRALAVGSQHPEARWGRNWDGWWRQFIFDLPVHQQGSRVSLIRWLRHNGFGYLQDSARGFFTPYARILRCSLKSSWIMRWKGGLVSIQLGSE
jgi:DNA-binding transcriptional regulator PaaX